MMVNVLLTPAARLKPSQITLPPTSPQSAEVSKTKSAGGLSSSDTLDAVPGPLLRTVTLKAPADPRTMLAEPVRMIDKSAGGQLMDVACDAELLPATGSVVVVVADARLVAVTGHAPFSGNFN